MKIDWGNVIALMIMAVYCLFVAGCALAMTNSIMISNGLANDYSWFSIFAYCIPIFIASYIICGIAIAAAIAMFLMMIGA